MGFPKVVVIVFTCYYVRRIRLRASILSEDWSGSSANLKLQEHAKKQVLTKILIRNPFKTSKNVAFWRVQHDIFKLYLKISVFICQKIRSSITAYCACAKQVLIIGQILLMKIIWRCLTQLCPLTKDTCYLIIIHVNETSYL